MPNRTIAKFLVFVILASIAGAAGSCANSLHPGRDSGRFSSENSSFDPPRLIGKLASADILESSGLAVSKCQQNVFWTHNDSGDDAFIYAFAGDGKHLGTWRVTGAVNRDWEDMASTKDADGGYL